MPQKASQLDVMTWLLSILRIAAISSHLDRVFLHSNGSEDIETVATIDVLVRGGVKLTIASVEDSKEVVLSESCPRTERNVFLAARLPAE